jgi:hypothetical protein
MRHIWLIGTVAAVGFGGLAVTAQAAPLRDVGVLGQSATSDVEKAARRCWWHRGHRHCRYYGYREYGYPENYRTGSRRWWEEMDREGRGGRRR